MATFVSLSGDGSDTSLEYLRYSMSLEFLRLLDSILNPSNGDGKEAEQQVKLGDLQKLAKQKQYVELIEGGLFKHSKAIFAASEDEIEAVITVVLALLDQILSKARSNVKKAPTEQDLCKSTIDKLASLLASDPEHIDSLKLSLLSLLFNILGEGHPSKFHVLLSLAKFAKEAKQPGVLGGDTFAELDKWVEEWGLSLVQQRQLLQVLTAAMGDAKMTDLQGSYRLKYLSTLSTRSDTKELQEAEPLAADEVRTALHNITKSTTNIDLLLHLPAIQALKSSKKQKLRSLAELLFIFGEGSIEQYMSFSKKNQAFLKEEGFDAEEQLSFMRTLSICDMGISTETISFEKIRKHLHLESLDDVEEAIIQAVGTGRVQAKIDQERQEVLLEQCQKRGFSDDDWHRLGDRIRVWRKHLQEVCQALVKQQTDAESQDM